MGRLSKKIHGMGFICDLILFHISYQKPLIKMLFNGAEQRCTTDTLETDLTNDKGMSDEQRIFAETYQEIYEN